MGEDWTQDDNEEYLGTGWDESEELAKKHSNSLFFKLEDGERELVNFVGQPITVLKSFQDQPPRPRIKLDVFIPGQDKLKTWETSPKVYAKVKRQYTRRGKDFVDAVFEIEREGTGMKTEYPIEYIRQLTEEERSDRERAKAGGSPSRGEKRETSSRDRGNRRERAERQESRQPAEDDLPF